MLRFFISACGRVTITVLNAFEDAPPKIRLYVLPSFSFLCKETASKRHEQPTPIKAPRVTQTYRMATFAPP